MATAGNEKSSRNRDGVSINVVTRKQKYEVFRAMHERPGAFVIPNPWNAGVRKS